MRFPIAMQILAGLITNLNPKDQHLAESESTILMWLTDGLGASDSSL
jgi:hypothetical protein